VLFTQPLISAPMRSAPQRVVPDIHPGHHRQQDYKKLEMPVLGLGGTGYFWLKAAVTPKATDFRLVEIENSGIFYRKNSPQSYRGCCSSSFDRKPA
jgi:hypothetical protein